MLVTAATTTAGPSVLPAAPSLRRGAVRLAALAAVWATMAASAVVFAEPAPVDMLLVGLVVLLPAVGLVLLTPALVAYLVAWLAIAAAGFLAAPFAADAARATTHTAVTLYLSLASVVVAGFVARAPSSHARVVLGGLVGGGVVATLAGLAGYFSAIPGAYELFTKFGRAAGTFKDPNVFGAYLVLPVLYCLHVALHRSAGRAMVPVATAALLALGVMLSFSRGAWINLGFALSLFGYLTFVTAPTATARLRIALLAGAALVAIAASALVLFQNDRVAELLSERATLSQSYDTGPEGRFGGQDKALRLVAENPLGIGAQEFTQTYHHEEVHNVYLSMALNAGWLGGGLFLVLNALTIVAGVAAYLESPRLRPLVAVTLSAFAATAIEGVVIDSDHWRHLFVEMALVWGLFIGGRERSRSDAEDHSVADRAWSSRP